MTTVDRRSGVVPGGNGDRLAAGLLDAWRFLEDLELARSLAGRIVSSGRRRLVPVDVLPSFVRLAEPREEVSNRLSPDQVTGLHTHPEQDRRPGESQEVTGSGHLRDRPQALATGRSGESR